MPHYIREISRTFDVGPTPRLHLRTVNGPVKVQGEDRAGVRIMATVRFRADTDAEAQELMAAVETGIYSDGERVNVHSPDAEGGALFGALRTLFGHRHIQIDLEVSAPRGCSLELDHVNGSVDVRRIDGEARLHMVNGLFDVTEIGGDVSVQHVNGRGVVRDVAGRVEVRYTNGALDVERVGGDLDVHLVNGRVEVLEPRRSVTVRGVSGAYSLTGAIRGDVTISNAHGRITLVLPRDSRFRLDAQSGMGSVASELQVRDGGDRGDAGVPSVSLRSETGRIELRALREAEPAAV